MSEITIGGVQKLYVDPNNPDHLSSTPFRTQSESTPSPVRDDFRERVKQELIRTHVIVRDEVEEVRAIAVYILSNCAAHFARPEQYRPGNPQESIDMAINNATRKLDEFASHIRTQERERCAKLLDAAYPHLAAAIREG